MERDREERLRARARRIAAAMIAAIIVLQLGHVVLGVATGSLADQGGVQDVIYVVVTILSSMVFALVGGAIVRRQPRNTIGWLMLVIPLVTAAAFFVGDYATEALATGSGSLPFGRFAAWLDRWMSLSTTLVFIPLFLLFPDGHIASRRWRVALWLSIAGPALAIVSFALTPGRLTGGFADLTSVTVTNPFGVPSLRDPLNAMTLVGGAMSFAAAIVAGISLVVRFRQSTGETRQQIKWLSFVALAFIAEFGLMVVGTIATNDNDLVGEVGFLVMFLTIALGIPTACGVAILKYRLYDLDVVVRKTVVFGLLAIFITLVYIAVVGGIGALIGSTSNTVLSFAAAAALAILFQPARERANRLADRLVYGKRATPYEVLAEFSGRVGETYATDDVLPRMAQLLGEGSGAASAAVWLRVGAEIRPAASWPEHQPADALAVEGDALPAFPGRRRRRRGASPRRAARCAHGHDATRATR